MVESALKKAQDEAWENWESVKRLRERVEVLSAALRKLDEDVGKYTVFGRYSELHKAREAARKLLDPKEKGSE